MSTRQTDDLPWPPWLENLSDRDRIHAIAAAVATCYSHNHDSDCSDDGPPHCTVTMAGRFLVKLLATGERDRVTVSKGAELITTERAQATLAAVRRHCEHSSSLTASEVLTILDAAEAGE